MFCTLDPALWELLLKFRNCSPKGGAVTKNCCVLWKLIRKLFCHGWFSFWNSGHCFEDCWQYTGTHYSTHQLKMHAKEFVCIVCNIHNLLDVAHNAHKVFTNLGFTVSNIHNLVCKTGRTNEQLQANGAKACGKDPSGTCILAASSCKRKWSHRQVPGFGSACGFSRLFTFT